MNTRSSNPASAWTRPATPASLMTTGAFSAGNRFLAITTTTTAYVADLATGTERLSTPSQAVTFTAGGQGLVIATPARPDLAGSPMAVFARSE